MDYTCRRATGADRIRVLKNNNKQINKQQRQKKERNGRYCNLTSILQMSKAFLTPGF